MKWVPMQWGGEKFEWIQLSRGRWGLVGHQAEVFSTGRGWGASVGHHFLGYYPRRNKAMEAVVSYIAYQKKLRELQAKEVS